MMPSPEVMTQISNLRAKQAAGDELSLEEMRNAIRLMRQDRVSSAEAAKTATKAKATKSKSSDAASLLDDLSKL